MSLPLLAELRDRAANVGLNLFGLVDARQFDQSQPSECRARRLLPDCGTIVMLGSGGQQTPRACAAANELAVVVRRQEKCVVVVPGPRAGIRFVCLAEAAGLGIVSPVSGLLLHPQFGPWVQLRAALLVSRHPFGPIVDASLAERFNPCCACSRPCVTACPASAHDEHGRHDAARCHSHRQAGGCAAGCARQTACPIGSEHRVGETQMYQHTLTDEGSRLRLGIGFRNLMLRFRPGARD